MLRHLDMFKNVFDDDFYKKEPSSTENLELDSFFCTFYGSRVEADAKYYEIYYEICRKEIE
ncbi:MAG: hypothetical protein ACTSQJ_12535 [Promethearchaeota archaeon]